MSVIRSLSTCTPGVALSQAESFTLATSYGLPPRPAIERLYERSGVERRSVVHLHQSADRERHSTLFHDGAPPSTAERMRRFEAYARELATIVANQALEEAGVLPEEVSSVIVVSCTGLSAPGIDISLITDLGLPADTERYTLGFMGCHGALNGLRLADSLISASPSKNVLLLCLELCSLHFNPEQVPVANALFADGAAAVVLSGNGEGPKYRRGFCRLLPDTESLMSWRIGDQGFMMHLSPELPSLLEALVPQLLFQELAGERIQHYAIHPGGPRILQAVARGLDLQSDDLLHSEQILKRFGNMSSPTVLFVLEALRKDCAAGNTLTLAFGPGIYMEGALLEL